MDGVFAAPKLNKSQRETHSEIERKRRERMKRDTEFLRKQIASPQCKDKLSIYQTGAERLIQYTDKLGKRDYIINDEEYSRIIMNTFDGFSIHIRSSDGTILGVTGKVEQILGVTAQEIIGTTIYNLAEPGVSTKDIITEVLNCTDAQWDSFNGLISRNFILALRCGPNIPACHCVYGSDWGKYRFIEFCGDLSRQGDQTQPEHMVVSFRGLCRPLDPASGTIEENRAGTCTSAQHFTLRLSPDTFQIVEAVGDFVNLLGCSDEYLLRKPLHDICEPSDRDTLDRLLNEVHLHSPVSGPLHLIHKGADQAILFNVVLTAIRLGSYFHCVTCRVSPPHGSESAGRSSFGSYSLRIPDSSFSRVMPMTPALRSMKLEDDHHSNRLQPSDSSSSEAATNNRCQAGSQFSSSSITDESTQNTTFEHPGVPTNDSEIQNAAELSALCPDLEEEWFKNVDTSSFQSLLNSDYLPSPDCYS